MQRLVSLVAFSAAFYVHTTASQPCSKSGYCSKKDATEVFIGDVSSSDGLHKALSLVSSRKDIIIAAFNVHYMDQLLQLQRNVVQLGYGHFLPIAIEPEHCIKYLTQVVEHQSTAYAYSNHPSCAWDSSSIHANSFHHETHLWHLRWRFVARASRLGYNVLSIDSDMVIYDDFYQYLKQPPFASINFMCAWESGCGCNGGWVYVQNAAPDGPTTWIFKHVTDVPLRWQDDGFAFLQSQGKQRSDQYSMCLTFDQSFIADALASALANRTMNPAMLMSCRAEPPPQTAAYITAPGAPPYNPSTHAIIGKSWELLNCEARAPRHQFPAPQQWGDLSGVYEDAMGTMTTGFMGSINVPPPADDHDELLSRFYPAVRGNYSLAFLQQLKQDCPDCPWWPGFEGDLGSIPSGAGAGAASTATALMARRSASNAAAITAGPQAPAPRQELFAMPPSWLINSFIRARNGLLLPLGNDSQPRQVFAHIHVTGAHGSQAKMALRKVMGAFDPSLQPQHPFLAGKRPKRLLMLSPSIDLSRTRNTTEYSRILAGLLQVALMSGRTVVYPDLPCHTPWLHTVPTAAANCDIPLSPKHYAYPRVDFTVLPQPPQPATASPVHLPGAATRSAAASVKLALPWTWYPECLVLPNNGAMIEAELPQWLQAADQQAGFAAVLLPGRGLQPPAAAAPATADWSPADALVVLPAEQVVQELSKVADVPALYLGTPVQVAGALSTQVDSVLHASLMLQLAKSCKALHWGEDLQHNQGLPGLFGGYRGSVVDGLVVADAFRVWDV